MGEWDTPQLRSLLLATASGGAAVDTYEFSLNRPGQPNRCLILNAHKLLYVGANDASDFVRLMLAINDITEARAGERRMDDLLRERAALIQEVQHRVANSLQIIASVLLQGARRVQSEETRGHLRDAHNRVMSISAVQRQLAASSTGDVALKTYFNELCRSLGASMIDARRRLFTVVDVDDSRVAGDTSITLGLMVTELVINALKHGYPDEREGRIVVGYHAQAGGWELSIVDDGVGMPAGGAPAKAGLGTSIVQARAPARRAYRGQRPCPGYRRGDHSRPYRRGERQRKTAGSRGGLTRRFANRWRDALPG